MSSIPKRRALATVTSGVGLALALAACSGGDAGSTDAGGASASDTDCAAYEQYGDLAGKTVSVYTSIVAPEDQPHIDSYVPFEECTGAEVAYEGSKEFEAQLQVRLASGNPPDIAYIPQPGLLRTLVTNFPDDVKPAPQPVIDNVDEYFTASWKAY